MPFPIDEVIWDYQPLADEVVPGEEVEVALFAIKRATVYGFLTNLRLAGLEPDVVEISPLALYNFLVFDRAVETGTVIIDIGAGNTDLVIMDGEKFWTRNVSISGNDITRALQEKYQISFEEAENLKRKAATSRQAERLFGVMRPILDDLIGEIQRSIGYYKAQSRNVRIEQIILLGNVFKLKGLIGYFRKNLDYDVALLDSLRRVKLGAESDTRKFEAELPNYGAAIGLALQAMGLGRVDIDLMPRDVVRQRLLKRKIPWAAAAVGLLAVPIALGFGRVGRTHSEATGALPAIQREIDSLTRKRGELDELSRNDTVEGQLTDFAKPGDQRTLWIEAFDKLNKAFDTLDRDEFLVLAVRQIVPGERRRGRPGREPDIGLIDPEQMGAAEMPGMPPPPAGGAEADEEEEKKPSFIIVEVEFEKKGRRKGDETERLRKLLDPAGELLVKFEGMRARRDRDLPASRRALDAADPDQRYYVYTFRVLFGRKPESKDPASEGDAAGG
jgi:type IV pilus assembly protein PilM